MDFQWARVKNKNMDPARARVKCHGNPARARVKRRMGTLRVQGLNNLEIFNGQGRKTKTGTLRVQGLNVMGTLHVQGLKEKWGPCACKG